MNYVFFVSSSNSLIKNDCRGRRGLFDSAGSNTDPLGELGPAQVPDCHLGTIRRKVAGPTAMRDGKTCGRLCVRPQRRVNCASHRSQAKAVLSTGTHCMCRQVLHRTFVPRTTVSDLLIAANNTTTDPRSPLPIGKRDPLVMKK